MNKKEVSVAVTAEDIIKGTQGDNFESANRCVLARAIIHALDVQNVRVSFSGKDQLVAVVNNKQYSIGTGVRNMLTGSPTGYHAKKNLQPFHFTMTLQ